MRPSLLLVPIHATTQQSKHALKRLPGGKPAREQPNRLAEMKHSSCPNQVRVRTSLSAYIHLLACSLVLAAINCVAADQTILEAAREGDFDKVFALLHREPGAIMARGTLGYTPLQEAAAHGHTDVAKLLLAQGADINATNRVGMTALALARGFGRHETAKFLEDRGGIVIERPPAPAVPRPLPVVTRSSMPNYPIRSATRPVWPQTYQGGRWATVAKACDECGKPVSLGAGVGDRCPHCGVIWSAERYQYGGFSGTSMPGL